MASWADQIPQFKPYSQQLPVEAMVAVGMEKQRRYDEGIQRIQSSIDRVAGLDIVRDVDRNYLQSKLDELGNNLKSVAGGDFSSAQLTNSVAGMATKVGKDKVVTSSVLSTAKMRKQIAAMEEARKNGKSSVNREYDFNNELNSWINGTTPGEAFNGQYREHIDVNKKVLDIIGKLHPKVNVYDIPYTIDKNGNINWGKIADAIQRVGETKVDEGQIKTAVSSMLEADDYDELASQGRYNYRSYNQDDLTRQLTRNYTESKEAYFQKLKDTETKLKLTTDPTQQVNLQKIIKYYKGLIGDDKTPGLLDETYNSMLGEVQTDPNKVKGMLYTRNWLDEIGNGFAYSEIRNELGPNPYELAQDRRERRALANISEAHDWSYKQADINLKERDQALKEKQAEGGEGANYLITGDPSTRNIESLSNWRVYQDRLTAENNGIIDYLIGRRIPFDERKNLDEAGKARLRDRMEGMITDYKNGDVIPANDYEKQMLDQYITNETNLKSQQNRYNQAKTRAYDRATLGEGLDNKLNRELRKTGDLNKNFPLGGGISMSAREVYDYLTTKDGVNLPESQLTPNERQLRKIMDRLTSGAGYLSKEYEDVDKYLLNMKEVIKSMREIDERSQGFIADELSEITGEFGTERSAVTFKTEANKDNLIAELSAVVQGDIQDKTGDKGYDPVAASKLLDDKNRENIKINIVRKGDIAYAEIYNGNEPKKTQLIPITSQTLSNATSLGESYLPKNLNVAEQLLRNDKTTNIDDKYESAYYHNQRLGSYDVNGQRTVTIKAKADLMQAGNGLLYPIFRLKIGDIEYRVDWYKPVNIESFENGMLPKLNNKTLIDIFKTRYPDIEQRLKEEYPNTEFK